MRLILMAFATLAGVLGARGAHATELEVVVKGIEAKGRVMIAIIDEEAAWNGKGASLVSIDAKANAPTMSFRVHVPPGRIAIRSFHDENGNGELDSNMLGIPKEGYGFSTNPRLMGPASFEDAVFEVKGKAAKTTIEIQ